MKKKIVSLMLIASMILSMLAGCGDQNKETTAAPTDKGTEAPGTEAPGTEAPGTEAPTDAPKVEVTYPLEEKVKLTVGIPTASQVTAICASHGDTPFFKEWQKRTGVELEFVEMASKDMGLMFTSDPLPDIILSYNMSSYPGGVAAALEDGVIIPITQYLDECAPDFKAVLEAKPVASRVVYVGDEVVGFPKYTADKYTATYGMVIRQDWLDDLKMEVPTNADDLYEVLKAFKEKKGATYPLSPWSAYFVGGLLNAGMITSSFGLVNTDYYVNEDGKIEAGFIQDEARDVLEYLNKLYKEELVDPNFAANDNAMQMANFTSGVSGMAIFAISSGLTPVVQAVENDPNFKITPMAPFKTPDGGISMYAPKSASATPNGGFITSDCKNVEAAVKFLNYGFTKEGQLLMNFGIEGESYEMVNGVPQYTDLIYKNPNMNKTQAAWQYTRVLGGVPMIQMNEYMVSYNPGETQAKAFAAWADSKAADYAIPTLVMTGDRATEHSQLSTDLSTYIGEMFTKFIDGTESLDNWDAFVAQCKALKVDRVVEIKQEFYDEQYGK